MAKVIEPAYKFKPIKCSVCGCTYEYEDGDYIKNVIYRSVSGEAIMGIRKLNCPVCGNDNALEVEGEK